MKETEYDKQVLQENGRIAIRTSDIDIFSEYPKRLIVDRINCTSFYYVYLNEEEMLKDSSKQKSLELLKVLKNQLKDFSEKIADLESEINNINK